MTNELDYKLDLKGLEDTYTFMMCESTRKDFSCQAQVLDCPALSQKIRSVRFTQDKSFYIMMDKTPDPVRTLKRLIADDPSSSSLRMSEKRPRDIEDHILIQLLMNAMGNYDTDYLRFNNLTGVCMW